MNVYGYQWKGKRKWRYDKRVNGTRLQAKGFRTRKEAHEALQKRLKGLQRTDTDFMRLCREYLDYAQIRFVTKTYKYKVATVRNLLAFLQSSEWPVSLDLQRYLDSRAKATSPNAYNADRKDLHAMFQWGVAHELAAHNPLQKISKMGCRKATRYIPPVEHINAVLLCAGPYRDLLEAMLYSLGRKSEILKLRWEDIDFERNTIRLWTRKRKDGSYEYDELPMPKPLYALLIRRSSGFRGTERSYVFINPRTKTRFSHLSQLMRRLCKRANVLHFGFHAFRHYGASYLIARGTDLKTVQLWLRHRNIETTRLYVHEMPDSVKRGAEILGEMGQTECHLNHITIMQE